ncbi:DeoR/GlpR family DNA-binding transcription regulator [Carnobacterium gallinarum]|uniref:DeoR/GlpR family DNA-binding transcription regulator n=1 Tax=Carnobacterium gallinarum TaxID=2749 RepID=UPI0005549104|nr:DeoR/GlpR family DNA-binding transcription regulator [Carnobacterium gallinarum]
MTQEKRISEIKRLLQQKNELSTNELITYFAVSRDTIRRDLLVLSKEGTVKRTHGGIMKIASQTSIPSYSDRLYQLTPEKEKIAQLANQFITSNQFYFFDVSTSVLKLSQLVKKTITVYTHSLDNSIALSGKEVVSLHLLGGAFNQDDRFFYSLNEAELVQDVQFECAFIGAGAINSAGVYFKHQEDAYIKKLIKKQSKQVILLAENTTFTKNAPYKGLNLQDIDIWITNEEPTKRQRDLFDERTKILY